MLSGLPAQATIHRNVALDIDFGTPNILHVGGQVLVWPRVQFGFGYGMLFAIPAVPITLPSQDIELDTGITVKLTPKLKFKFSNIVPFIRYFPHLNNFYIQFSYPLLTITGTVSGSLSHPLLGELSDTALTGTLVLTQPLPTLSVGYFFGDDFLFFNLAIGASVFFNPLVSATVTSAFPTGAGSNDAALSEMTSQLQTQLGEVTAQMRQLLPFVPSVTLSFGFFL